MLIFLFSLLKGKMEIHFAFACVGNKDKIKTARGNRFLRSGSCPYPDIKGKKLFPLDYISYVAGDLGKKYLIGVVYLLLRSGLLLVSS